MTKKLFFLALTKFVVGLSIVMVLLFIPAGTLCYWQAWLFIGILFIPMLIVGFVLMNRNPELLHKRLSQEIAGQKAAKAADVPQEDKSEPQPEQPKRKRGRPRKTQQVVALQ